MRVELDPSLCILGISYLIIWEKFQVAALLLLILTLTEPPNAWKSEIYLFLGRYTVDLFTHFKARPISNVLVWYPELTTMTSVSVRFKKMTASHRLNYRVKPKTIINNQGNWGTVSIKNGLQTAYYGLRTGYKIRTRGAIHSTKIPTGPTRKIGPPQKVDPFFRNFSGWTKPIHWDLDGNFRKFWLNGSRLRYKRRTGKYGLGIKHGLGIKRGLQTGYKIEILGGGSLNQEPDKNAIFYTHYRHGLCL